MVSSRPSASDRRPNNDDPQSTTGPQDLSSMHRKLFDAIADIARFANTAESSDEYSLSRDRALDLVQCFESFV